MTPQELVDYGKVIYKSCLEILAKKGHDYSGTEDAFKNFNNATIVGVTAEQGVMVRMIDKVSRLSQLLTSQAKVKDERFEDTCQDLINYTLILSAIHNEHTKSVDSHGTTQQV